MAEGEIRIADMTASSGLTNDDNFVVDKAGSNGTKKFSAADYIANKAELTDIRVGADGNTYATAGDAVRSIYNVLCDSLVNSYNNKQTFRGLGNFQHYGLNPNGTFLTSQKYRVSNDDPISFDRTITIKVASGFKWGYIPFNSGTPGNWKGWYTKPITIPKGKSFVIQIARTTEQTSEIANVNTFLNALTFETATNDVLNDLEPTTPKVFSIDDILQGVWSDGGNIPEDTTRICTSRLYGVKKGNSFSYTVGSGIQLLYGIFSKTDNSLLFNSGWITENTSKEDILKYDGLFFFQIKKNNGGTVSPSDYSGTYTLYYGLDDIVKRLQNENIISVDIDNYSIEQGTIDSDGTESANSKRVRTGEFILNNFKTVKLTDNTMQFGIHFYGENKNHLSNTSWLRNEEYTIDTVSGCKYIKLVVSFRNDDDIEPSDVENAVFLSNDVNNATTTLLDEIEVIDKKIDEVKKPLKYIGESIPATKTFLSSRLLTMSYSGITSQDIDCFGDYMIVSFSGTEQIKIYSMTTKQLLASVEVETHHGSGMQFSNEYYDEDDDFPLLYVGGWTDNLINKIRITKSGDTWSASVVKVLYIPTTEGYYLAPSIDSKNNILYCYGYKIESVTSTGNAMILLKCDLSDLTDNGDNTYTPEILERKELPYEGVMQGRKYYNNRLYVGFANMDTPHNCRLVAIDVESGEIKTDVDMSQVTTSENEGVCFEIVGNSINWYYSDYTVIYKLDF